MRDVMGVRLGSMVKDKEEVWLCFDWKFSNQDEGMSRIKVRYGNRKFFSTLFKTGDIDSIMLLRWKNDANGHSYEIRKPEISHSDDLFRIDLTKEFAAMGMELYEDNGSTLKSKISGGYVSSEWIHVGEYGYYYTKYDDGEDSREFLKFCFAYPGVKIGNSLVTKIEIDTFDSTENMEPLYDFMRTVMDEPSAVVRYTEDEIAELFKKHFPRTMHIDIWCQDKLLSASIDHLGSPHRWFTKKDIVNEIRNYNLKKIEAESPLELVVKELGL